MTYDFTSTFAWGLGVALAAWLSASAFAAPENVPIATRQGPKAIICVASADDLMQRTGEWCRDFLAQHGWAVESALAAQPPHRTGTEARPDRTGTEARPDPPLWTLEVEEHCPIAKSLGIQTSFLETARADAYLLNVFRRNEQAVVSIVGREAFGVRSGVARLVALMAEQGRALTAPAVHEERTPFFPVRRLSLAPTGRIAQGGPWADTLWTNWSDERIRQYAEQVWLLGYNSVEVAEIRGYRGVFSDEELRKNVTPKLRVLMRAAHDYGLTNCQFIWGQSLFVEGQNLCWNALDERPRMEAEFRRLAQTYGDLVDHIIVHVGDPGGCTRNGCDAYQTTQELTTFLLQEYRRVNPRVTATLSTWANFGFWKGKPGVAFLDETYSPREVGIALHRWYDRDKARIVQASGRPVDVWVWYLGDFEMTLDVTLAMRTIDRYYSALPESATQEVRAITSDLCFHGWPQILNAYVAAQKMWSLRRDLREIEREFCAATFGDENADAMVAVYEASEACVHPDRYAFFRPETDGPPEVFGTPEYNRQLRAALALGEGVHLDSARRPRFTSATEPKALYDYLLRNLRLIAVFSEAQERINRERKADASPEELQNIVQEAEAKAAAFQVDPDYPTLLAKLKASCL